MAYVSQVPVMLMNTRIGLATVHDSGEIEITAEPTQLGRDVYQWLVSGMVSGMSFAMIVAPARPLSR